MTPLKPDRDTFAVHVNTRFDAAIGENLVLPLVLMEVQPGQGPAGLHQFSLLFHGPLTPVLAQKTQRITHDVLGEMDLFIVPVGRDAAGMQYEVIFNNLPGRT